MKYLLCVGILATSLGKIFPALFRGHSVFNSNGFCMELAIWFLQPEKLLNTTFSLIFDAIEGTRNKMKTKFLRPESLI